MTRLVVLLGVVACVDPHEVVPCDPGWPVDSCERACQASPTPAVGSESSCTIGIVPTGSTRGSPLYCPASNFVGDGCCVPSHAVVRLVSCLEDR